MKSVTFVTALFSWFLALLAAIGAADGPGEARFLSNTRQLTFEGRRSGEGYFSSDGKALVFNPPIKSICSTSSPAM